MTKNEPWPESCAGPRRSHPCLVNRCMRNPGHSTAYALMKTFFGADVQQNMGTIKMKAHGFPPQHVPSSQH